MIETVGRNPDKCAQSCSVKRSGFLHFFPAHSVDDEADEDLGGGVDNVV